MRCTVGKFQTSIVLGCAGLLAIAAPALGQPVPKPKPVIERPHKNLTQRAERNKAARGERLVSMRVMHEPKRPALGWPVLVKEARKYMGTNPTRRSRLWCATFMNMVLAKAGYSGTNSDAAKSFAQYGRRISEPKVGAIAVLTRGKNGGHVGVVSGVDANGNPIIISGNHGAKVGEAVYPRARVIAYVMPSESRGETTETAERTPQKRAAPDERAPQKRVAPDGGLESPIAELMAAIEAERNGRDMNRFARTKIRAIPEVRQAAHTPPREATKQAVRQETPKPAREMAQPATPPAAPHLVVQQTAETPAPASRAFGFNVDLAGMIGIGRAQAAPAPQR